MTHANGAVARYIRIVEVRGSKKTAVPTIRQHGSPSFCAASLSLICDTEWVYFAPYPSYAEKPCSDKFS